MKASKLLIVPSVIVGLVLLIMVAVQIVLSPRLCTRIVREAAPSYFDGSFEVGKVSVSLFKRFPAIIAEVDSLTLTYPSERFDSSECSGYDTWLMHAGCSRTLDGSDTLLTFSHLSAAINVLPLLSGKINVKFVELFKPRAYLHFYNDGRSNLDIFKFVLSQDNVEDTSAVVLPPILLRQLSLDKRAVVCYTSQKDSLAAMLLMKDFFFKGHLSLDNLNKCDFDSRIDSLLLLGNNGKDTLLFDLDHFNVGVSQQTAQLSADAKLYGATRNFGRIKIPAHLGGKIGYDIPSMERPYQLSLSDVNVTVAAVDANVNMDVELSDSIGLNGTVEIDSCRVSDVIDEYLVKFIPILSSIGTDASISANVAVNGYYNSKNGTLPSVDAEIKLPQFSIFGKTSGSPSLLHAKAFAGVKNLLGNDPEITLDAALNTDLDKIDYVLGKKLEMKFAGGLKADVKGKFCLSELTSLNFRKGTVDAAAMMSDVRIQSYDDTLNLFVHSLDAKAGMKSLPRIKQSSLVCETTLDSVFFNYSDAAVVSGKNIKINAFASSSSVKVSDTLSYRPFFVKADISSLRMTGTDSLGIRLRNSSNSFSIHPPFEKGKDGKLVRSKSKNPVIHVISRNAMVMAKQGLNRIFLRQLDFNGQTSLHQRSGRQRTPRQLSGKSNPADDEYRQSDISFDLGQTFKNFIRKWDIQGALSLKHGGFATPYFPLRTRIGGFGGQFNNNSLKLDSLTLLSGSSHMHAEGQISNIKAAVLRGRTLGFTLNLRTDSLNVNELLTTYYLGQQNREKDLSYLESADFNDVEEKMSTSVPDSVQTTRAILLPSNIDATVSLEGKGVKYSIMDISQLAAQLKIRNRCLLFEDFKAESNVGRLQADAFYSTTTKNDICAGFDLDMNDISAKQMIAIVPSVDTLFPLLKSFSGMLNCSVAAKTKLDTSMNVVLNSLDGVIRISGTDLRFKDNPDIKKLAKKLMFKQPDNTAIDSMMVEGILKDNSLEVFPFMLRMDRWRLALAGIQNMDKSFNYHVSLIESPLIFKMGVNLYGKDFDHIKVKIGKARFKSEGNLPVFTKQIDSTRINLVESIRNVLHTGAERAIRDFMNKEAVDSTRRSQSYEKSAALENLEN